MFDEAVPLLGVQFAMTLFLGGVLVIQFARFMKWAERTTVEQFLTGRRGPRLIVNGAIQFFVIACATIGTVLVIYMGVHQYFPESHQHDWLCTMMVESNKYAMGFLIPVTGVLLFSLRYLRPGLDILLDVINHFYFRGATHHDYKQDPGEDYDLEDVTFNGGKLYFSRRDSIHRRMKRILDYFRHTMPGRPALTIVSHSQGSMIAIEVLNDDELAWVTSRFSRINMVTMGSPFHHLYQNYFANFYPGLDDPMWENLRSRVHRWLNIFRIDDYVGTEIPFPPSLPQVASGHYTNHAVERRGHLFYWRDRQVLDVVRQHDICGALARGNPARRNAA
jgi:hypothetical protein